MLKQWLRHRLSLSIYIVVSIFIGPFYSNMVLFIVPTKASLLRLCASIAFYALPYFLFAFFLLSISKIPAEKANLQVFSNTALISFILAVVLLTYFVAFTVSSWNLPSSNAVTFSAMQQFLSGWGFGFLSGLCVLAAGYFFVGKKVNALKV